MDSLPKDYLKQMKELLKDGFEAFLGSYENENTRALRLNALKGDKGELVDLFLNRSELAPFFHLRRVNWEELGFYYEKEDEPGVSPYHDAGVYYIQEPSAMLPVNLMDIDPTGMKILDLCAAPGGKSSQIAARMQGRGLLVCNEIHPERAKVLSGNIERMAVRNAVVLNETPDKLSGRFPGFFDRILVDAPCSGEGMFRKNENAISEWSMENVRMCAKRQKEILCCSADMLKEGGKLVYSTCTFSKEENEEVIEDFLVRHPEYELTESKRLYPHLSEGEGHFAAVLEKKNHGMNGNRRDFRIKPQTSLFPGDVPDFWDFADNTLKEVSPALGIKKKDLSGKILLRFGDNLYLAPEGTPELKGFKVLRPGLHLGTSRKNRFEPSHALALALKPDQVKRYVNLGLYLDNGEQKKQSGESEKEDGTIIKDYLRGLTFNHNGENGWYLICVDGFSLGFGKLSQGVMKNHYPKGIRKMI
ncbi:MAG: RsmF rRNA methyltransferase first C-terminal domain-containing protein [Lachnospiraceae bacterium]|nr:RsmF rRNA methyltransferase first C-terminal domain-containing protein [Lachnospiraceae bacterium]